MQVDEDVRAPEYRPLTGGAVMGAVSRVSVAITGAATTIAVARLLGPSGTGGFAVALTITYVLTVMTTLGVEHGVAYYVSNGQWQPRDAFRTVLRVSTTVGVAGAALGVVLRVLAPAPFGSLTVPQVAVAAAALPFYLTWYYASFVALADQRYEGYVLPPAAQSASGLVFVLVLGEASGLSGAIVGLLAGHVVAAVGTVAWGRRRLTRGGRTQVPERESLRRALRFGLKGYATNALQVLNFRVDVFILAALAPAATVGAYAVALGATAVLWLLPQAVSDVLFPRIAALAASDARAARDQEDMVISKSLRHTVLMLGTGAVVLAGLLALLIEPVYGPGFRPAVDLSFILIPGVCLTGVAGALWAIVVGRGHPEYGLYAALITTPLTMVLYAVLIPTYKATGAAWATTASFTMTFILAALFFRPVTGRRLAPLLVPTRSELDDYRRLWPQIRAWGAARLGR